MKSWVQYFFLVLFICVLLGLSSLYSIVTDDFSSYNHYEVLGIDQSAEKHEIKKAYRVMSLRHHPDKSSSKLSTIRFNRISEASETLLDDKKRHEYNFYLARRPIQSFRPKSMKWQDLLEFTFLELPKRGLLWIYPYFNLYGFFQFLLLLAIVSITIDWGLFLLRTMISKTTTSVVDVREKERGMRLAREKQQQNLAQTLKQRRTGR